jgi:hypothetical protein
VARSVQQRRGLAQATGTLNARPGAPPPPPPPQAVMGGGALDARKDVDGFHPLNMGWVILWGEWGWARQASIADALGPKPSDRPRLTAPLLRSPGPAAAC